MGRWIELYEIKKEGASRQYKRKTHPVELVGCSAGMVASMVATNEGNGDFNQIL